MISRRVLIKFALSVAISVLTFMFIQSTQSSASVKPGESLLLFFGKYYVNSNTVITGIISLIPEFVFFSLFAEFLSEDFSSMAVYIFTRTKRRSMLILKRLAKLFLFTALFYILSCLLSVLMLSLTGGEIAFSALFIEVLLYQITLQILVAFSTVVVITMLCIRYNEVKVLLTSVFLFLITAVFGDSIVRVIPGLVLFLIPTAGLFYLHDIPTVYYMEMIIDTPVAKGFSLGHSYLFLLCVIVVELFLFAKIYINKTDIF